MSQLKGCYLQKQGFTLSRQHRSDAKPSLDVLPAPSTPHDVNNALPLQIITAIMDNLMGLANPGGEIYTLVSLAAHIARPGPI